MNETEIVINKFRDDFNLFSHYAPLMIRPKQGGIVPLKLNQAQLIIHNALEEQLKEKGYVRAIIVKSRQQGASTYIAARFYWKTLLNGGTSAFVLAHIMGSSNALFDLVKRYHDNNETLPIPTAKSNAKELAFEGIDSKYKVGTAGSAEAGRGDTYQYLHGSEVAFWPNADEISAGLMEAVPNGVDAKGSEVVLESTGNGTNNYFYEQAMKANSGRSDYQLIFIPWFKEDKYRLPVPDKFELTIDEATYKDRFDLDDEQVYFRRMKIEEKGQAKFEQEYPSTLMEAFQTSSDGFIDSEKVLRARKKHLISSDLSAPIILGVDPSYKGGDRSVISVRRGREWIECVILEGVYGHDLAYAVGRMADKYSPQAINIDFGGDNGCSAKLKELGYKVNEIAFGGKSQEPMKYVNKRNEMIASVNTWLDGDVSIPDREDIQADLCAPQYGEDAGGRLDLESKKEMKKRGIPSTDILDSFALTFAVPVRSNAHRKPRINSGGFKDKGMGRW